MNEIVLKSHTAFSIHRLQGRHALLISASTFSVMAVSVDRYFTVKNYRPIGQVASRRQILSIAVLATWLSAAVLASVQILSKYKQAWKRGIIIGRITVVHVIPVFTVLLSHWRVHSKLTALSLTARAKHGELPLPIPLIRRPIHVIIVAGIPKGSDQIRNPNDQDAIEEAQPPTSTLRSRRRLARWLIVLSVMFLMCWSPYIAYQIYELVSASSEFAQKITLFIGHVHSALGPIFYCFMNNKWPNICKTLREKRMNRSASSTNEAALGPFHPRFIRPPPPNRRHSS
ncbi:hypothetical protein NQ317_009765, partial [Molorchus minor]